MADLLESKQDGVAILTMNRPEARNALSADMLAALRREIICAQYRQGLPQRGGSAKTTHPSLHSARPAA